VQSATSIEACRVFRQTTIKHEPLSGCAPYPTTAECLEHARYCEWYAARTNDDGDRKFVLRKVRYDSSVQVTGRTTLEYVDKIGGISLEKGQSVICLLGSANRDPLVYSDPDRLDITRRDVRPLSFGGAFTTALAPNSPALRPRSRLRPCYVACRCCSWITASVQIGGGHLSYEG
jgi:hypothetical protein